MEMHNPLKLTKKFIMMLRCFIQYLYGFLRRTCQIISAVTMLVTMLFHLLCTNALIGMH